MDAIPPALLAAQQQLCISFERSDAAGVAAIYAEAGQIMPAYSAAIRGRAAIQAFWQGCIDMGICTMQRIPLEVDSLAGTINEVGVYRFFDRQQHVLDVGKYVIIWKEQGGQWQIQCDIWTSNLPSG
ncbi:MAG: DUF4440 domain-containing protein [Caldilineaceae bacterium]